MKIKFSKAIGNAFSYALMRDHFLVYFAYTLGYLTALSYPMYNLFRAIGADEISMIFSSVLLLFGVIVVFVLVGVWFSLAYVRSYQTRHKKGSLRKAFIEVKGLYWRMLAVTIVVAVFSSIVSSVPKIGWLFSLIVSWIFLFVAQFVVIGKKDFGQVFTASWKNIKKYTWETLLVWIVDMLVVLGVMLLFVIPFLIYFFMTAFPYLEGDQFGAAFSALTANPIAFGGTLLIAIVGMTIASVFSIGMLTDVFMQIYKKK
jgi:hypothetical protein